MKLKKRETTPARTSRHETGRTKPEEEPTSAPSTPRLTVAPVPASYMDSFSDFSPQVIMLMLMLTPAPPPVPSSASPAGKKNSGRWIDLGLAVDWLNRVRVEDAKGFRQAEGICLSVCETTWEKALKTRTKTP